MGFFPITRRIAALSVLLAGSLAAQAMAPPSYLQIFREQVKVGRVAAHVPTEAGWPAAFAKAKIPNYYLALTTMYGPNEAWFVEGHASIAEIEAANQAIEAAPGLSKQLERLSEADAANLTSTITLLARYVPEASNSDGINPAEARIWEVTVFRVRPGKDASFFEGANLYKSLVQQAKANAPWATYQIMAGMPGPQYLVFSPFKTLADMDPTTRAGGAIQKVMNAETMKKFGELSEGFVSVENMVFSPSPEMSYLSEDWIKQDPKYWGKKAMAAAPAKPAAAAPKP